MDRQAACLAFTLGQEGGWSDNPADPGGATMKGVTLAVFRTWRHNPAASKADLHAIGDAELRAIYGAGYWQPPRCQDMPSGVDLMVFDMAVNAGVRRSSMLLQQAARVNLVDGWVGAGTLAAVRALPAAALVETLGAVQEAYYRGLPTFGTFGKGWVRRVDARMDAALAAARG